ncbi:MAG: glucokinase [Rubrivivax sp.]|nr:glucokinase [Rubrivivax sp.]
MQADHSLAPTSARLVADVGGSNARFGWIAPQGREADHVRTLPVSGYGSLADAAGVYLAQLRHELGPDWVAPRQAALAVATAVTGDAVDFTNSPWSFSQRGLRAALKLERLLVLNDFEALALALPHLRPTQLRPHAAAQADVRAAKAVIGPGTGLGVASCVPTPSGWVALPGEGGHATLAPGSDFEFDLLACIRREHDHVSAERLLSGIGLPVLHAAVCDLLGAAPPQANAPAIVDHGLAGDPLCRRTLDTFCALLGSFAGNVALTVGARGGVYIGGGIVPRLGDLFFASDFRERFEAKGRLRGYLSPIPTAVITDTLVALTGARAALDAPAA